MKINVGIIGFGRMGQSRYKALKKLNKFCNIVAISEEMKNINIKNCNVYNNHKKIINDKLIHAVFICTPNFLNKKITIEALKKNKHVFCEKPPALNKKEVLQIIEHEKKTKLKLMYGFNHREHESVKLMKKIIDTKKYGKILWMRGRYGKSVSKDFYKDWRSKKKFSGGGILIDQGIHLLDLLLYLHGDFDIIKSMSSNLYWKMDVEDNVFALLKDSKTGVSASIHSTMTQWRHLFSLEIFFEKGYLVLNGLKTSSGTYGSEVLTIAKNRSQTPAATWKDEKKIKFNVDNSLNNEVKIFINSILKNKKIRSSNSKDALQIMTLVDKIYKQSMH